jgi:hypothetical protein
MVAGRRRPSNRLPRPVSLNSPDGPATPVRAVVGILQREQSRRHRLQSTLPIAWRKT